MKNLLVTSLSSIAAITCGMLTTFWGSAPS